MRFVFDIVSFIFGPVFYAKASVAAGKQRKRAGFAVPDLSGFTAFRVESQRNTA
jgi:hypothetical protein